MRTGCIKDSVCGPKAKQVWGDDTETRFDKNWDLFSAKIGPCGLAVQARKGDPCISRPFVEVVNSRPFIPRQVSSEFGQEAIVRQADKTALGCIRRPNPRIRCDPFRQAARLGGQFREFRMIVRMRCHPLKLIKNRSKPL